MQGLPPPPPSFIERKKKILEQLSVPDGEYNDASPKGSVDEGIRELLDEINTVEGFVTTSSCAGRVSVFLEGRKTIDEESDDVRQVAGVGGKGARGAWLYVSHDPVPVKGNADDAPTDWVEVLGLEGDDAFQTGYDETKERRLIHFKFEAMILHILAASSEHAQLILRCGLQAGFRESGCLNIVPPTIKDPATPMVAIRTMGLAFESLIGQQVGHVRQRLVPPQYLDTLIQIANERFVENTKRIGRFQTALRDAMRAPSPKMNPEGEEWEDAAARRERKKAEGLRKKAEMQVQKEIVIVS